MRAVAVEAYSTESVEDVHMIDVGWMRVNAIHECPSMPKLCFACLHNLNIEAFSSTCIPVRLREVRLREQSVDLLPFCTHCMSLILHWPVNKVQGVDILYASEECSP